ncbi:MAG: ABC transporter ATP-binding protein [Planctomycetes bacterium]|nr:ABC transporter ATP-binding protein [Planctomycetota bacterium]
MTETTFAASEPPVEVCHLTRRFGATKALDDVSLTVPRGGVLGLIGGNGAGKTTLIKHLLGLYRPQSGTVRVFGLDPIQHPIETLSQIGYMSEDRDLPLWMRVGELLRYCQAFYSRWDMRFAEELRDAFDLGPQARVKTLSRGQRARASLLVALAYRPDLLLLDEPSAGLDPVVRRDILGAIIRTIADEGRTVIFSSHLLDEVERVADRIAIIHRGQIVLTASLDELKETHRRVTLRFDRHFDRPPELTGAISATGEDCEWTYVCSHDREQIRIAATAMGATIVGEDRLTLDEIFVSHIQG